MKVIAKRIVKANTIEVYAEISLQTERSDIQEYLQQLDESKIVKTARENKSILHHLQVIGILNHEHELTHYGKRVKDNGLHYQKEAGIYLFTLLVNDPLVNYTDILSVERVRPENSEKGFGPHQLSLDSSKEYEVSIVESGKNLPLKKMRLDKLSEMGVKKEAENLSLQLEWDEGRVEPVLKVFRQKNNSLCKNYTPQVQLNSFMEDLLNRRQMKWVEIDGKRRSALRLSALGERIESIENFEIGDYLFHDSITSYGKFDEIKIANLLICPLNNEEAKLWFERLLTINIQRGFITPTQFEKLANSFKKHEVLSHYRFDIPSVNDMLELLPANDKPNLAATYDLNPCRFATKAVQSQFKPITIVPDEAISMRQVLTKLKPQDKLLALFYYDSYVYSDFQQKCFIEFINVLKDDDTGVYLYTKFNSKDEGDKNIRSKYISHVMPSITEIDIAKINTTQSNHDRYLILVTAFNEIQVYKFTNSIDFISYPKNNDFNADTLGKSKDLSIIPVTMESIRRNIRIHIQNQIQSLSIQK